MRVRPRAGAGREGVRGAGVLSGRFGRISDASGARCGGTPDSIVAGGGIVGAS